MPESPQDMWSQWLLHRRFGGDQQRMQAELVNFLYPIRDKVLRHANLGEGETLLDVGCGDGLIAFGALEKMATSHVIFSDISHALLTHAETLAQAMDVLPRCQFLHAAADDLSTLPDASVDVVTTRSVLIYVTAKLQAFQEFYRVLRPMGRLSIFEPINRFAFPEPPHILGGYDVTPVMELAHKVKAVYRRLQPPETDPMLNFDERDLLAWAEQAGFTGMYLEFQVEIRPVARPSTWEAFLHTAGNPNIPTLAEALQQALTPEEAATLLAHLHPLVEARQGTTRRAFAYLLAVKHRRPA